jgi:hypothetical protein
VSWQDIVYNMLLAAVFYGGWRGVSVLVERERSGSRKLLRYIWPTVMVAWCWLMLWATSFPSESHWMGRSLDFLLIVFFAVNFPGAVLGNGLLSVMIDWPAPLKSVVASVAVWLLWYGIIRAWERWKARNLSPDVKFELR